MLIRRTAWLQAGEGLEVRIVSGAELDDLAPGLPGAGPQERDRRARA